MIVDGDKEVSERKHKLQMSNYIGVLSRKKLKYKHSKQEYLTTVKCNEQQYS